MFSHYAHACSNLSESHQFRWIYFNGLKIPLPIFGNFFFSGWNKLSEDSLYVIFSQYRSCDTTLGLLSDGTGRIFDGWKIFAQFKRNFRIRLNLFQLLSKVLPSTYAQCATSANPSWLTTHPCNHAFAAQTFSRLRCSHLAVPIFHRTRQNFDLKFSIPWFRVKGTDQLLGFWKTAHPSPNPTFCPSEK